MHMTLRCRGEESYNGWIGYAANSPAQPLHHQATLSAKLRDDELKQSNVA